MRTKIVQKLLSNYERISSLQTRGLANAVTIMGMLHWQRIKVSIVFTI